MDEDNDTDVSVSLRLLKDSHDPGRPHVDTGEAARQLGITRQAVAQAIQRGNLEGYGIPGNERIRWFVYQSAIDKRIGEDDSEISELRLKLARANLEQERLSLEVRQLRSLNSQLGKQLTSIFTLLSDANRDAAKAIADAEQ